MCVYCEYIHTYIYKGKSMFLTKHLFLIKEFKFFFLSKEEILACFINIFTRSILLDTLFSAKLNHIIPFNNFNYINFHFIYRQFINMETHGFL